MDKSIVSPFFLTHGVLQCLVVLLRDVLYKLTWLVLYGRTAANVVHIRTNVIAVNESARSHIYQM